MQTRLRLPDCRSSRQRHGHIALSITTTVLTPWTTYSAQRPDVQDGSWPIGQTAHDQETFDYRLHPGLAHRPPASGWAVIPVWLGYRLPAVVEHHAQSMNVGEVTSVADRTARTVPRRLKRHCPNPGGRVDGNNSAVSRGVSIMLQHQPGRQHDAHQLTRTPGDDSRARDLRIRHRSSFVSRRDIHYSYGQRVGGATDQLRQRHAQRPASGYVAGIVGSNKHATVAERHRDAEKQRAHPRPIATQVHAAAKAAHVWPLGNDQLPGSLPTTSARTTSMNGRRRRK
jgi:hypothetical protein